MKLGRRSSLADVARVVSKALRAGGIRAVLTGGACASLYTRGTYQSEDLDFVLQVLVTPQQLDTAMATVGFSRSRNQYVHKHTRYFVEFPVGPLGIGGDLRIDPVPYMIGGVPVPALSATDSCRDRLAAFYHWRDRQALNVAVAIALRHRIRMKAVRAWSEAEGALPQFEQFSLAVDRSRRTRSRERQPRSRS